MGTCVCTAGIGEPGVLSAILSWVDGEFCKGKMEDHPASIRVGGLISSVKEHVEWMEQDLRPGDEVVIRVVETERADTPRQRDRGAVARK